MSAESIDSSAGVRAAEAKRARRSLLAVFAAISCFLWFYVPRLNNYVLSDREFTGWMGPVAERLASGERPYVDFVLPIPPGSMIVLSIIQKLTGQALLLQELWVAAVSHLLMGAMAYLLAARLSSRKIALLVAVTTMVLVLQTPKECSYDHTSQLFAWASVTAGAHALLAARRPTKNTLWFLTGALATTTLAFKQSTAVGIAGGWALGLGYLTLVHLLERGRRSLGEPLRDMAHCLGGGLAGFAVVLVAIWATGSTVPAFTQSVFGDGPELKGGTLALLENIANFSLRHDATGTALVPTLVFIAIGVRLSRAQGSFHVGEETERKPSLTGRVAAWVVAAAVAAFGSATILLALEVRSIHRILTGVAEILRFLPAYGFAFAAAFFVAHLRTTAPEAREEHRLGGHAYNALLLTAVTSSLVFNTSFIHFTPFYYNNPDIPLALTCLFVALDRARAPRLTAFVFVLCLLPVFGTKLNRALSADTLVSGGHWAGLHVNYRGREILKAARRVQKLAGPRETVLVLPEDVQLMGVMRRPRPPVKGAILFVDQYPSRLLSHDLRAIDENLPKVIVIHPRRRRDWGVIFGFWNENSAAQKVVDHVLDDVLPKHYRLDSSYPTIFYWDQGQLDVWVRKDAEGADAAG